MKKMSIEPGVIEKSFYPFLGFHSFLIGLFPFYIPVYLYAGGFSLSAISLFIALTGFGYCLCLFFLERIFAKVSLRSLIIFSFISELGFLSLFFLERTYVFLIVAALANGMFNCAFWIIQRLLFLRTISPENSGRRFGNFQLFVLIVLKIAIFIGGLILESVGFPVLYLISAGVVVIGVGVFAALGNSAPIADADTGELAPLSVAAVISFADKFRSKWVFAVDGIFLYLESYFWVISLFLIVQESFSRLGMLIIVLTVIFGTIFIFIKNSIDTLPADYFYKGSVALYAFSWILRSYIPRVDSPVLMLLILALLTFCTSIFRLAFNKRFFDNAKSGKTTRYIFLKSYYSQGFLFLMFPVLLLFSFSSGEVIDKLSWVYLGAALVSLSYLAYRSRPAILRDADGSVRNEKRAEIAL